MRALMQYCSVTFCIMLKTRAWCSTKWAGSCGNVVWWSSMKTSQPFGGIGLFVGRITCSGVVEQDHARFGGSKVGEVSLALLVLRLLASAHSHAGGTWRIRSHDAFLC